MPIAPMMTGGILLASLWLSGCSGDMVPPEDVLSVSSTASPMMMVAPSAPVAYPFSSPLPGSQNPVDDRQADTILDAGDNYLQSMQQQITPSQPQMQQIQPQHEEPNEGRLSFLPRLSNPLARPEWAGGMPVSERNCRSQLKSLGVVYEDIPGFSKGPSCGIAHPVKLIGLSGGISMKPAATLNCQVTLAFAKWVKNELAPATRARYFTGVSSIRQLSSYSCRTMNSVRNAPMSEHSRGNAIDVGAVTLNNGKTIDVREPGFFNFREKSLLSTVRADSCNYFTTVLGPGYNRAHADHFHFDLRDRKSGNRSCR